MADTPDDEHALQPATKGSGPLYQRDYWVLVQNARMRPSEIGALLAERFCEFAPPKLVKFAPAEGCRLPLQLGDELHVDITGAPDTRVRVLHRDANSLTLGTLANHPEAGRITFGAYPNPNGDVVLHIRSRARSSSLATYAGFLAVGEAMQTTTWSDFLNALAATVGDGVHGAIHADTTEVEEDAADGWLGARPTFIARGG